MRHNVFCHLNEVRALKTVKNTFNSLNALKMRAIIFLLYCCSDNIYVSF